MSPPDRRSGRGPLRPALDAAPLSRPVHLLLRDYPELLGRFRREGIVDFAEAGAVDLAELSERHPGLPDAVVAATRWRGPGGEGAPREGP